MKFTCTLVDLSTGDVSDIKIINADTNEDAVKELYTSIYEGNTWHISETGVECYYVAELNSVDETMTTLMGCTNCGSMIDTKSLKFEHNHMEDYEEIECPVCGCQTSFIEE